MSDFVIFTDSACDIPAEVLREWGVKSCSLTFKFDGEEKVYGNAEMNAADFYQKMREGGVAKTSAINPETFIEAFEQELREGRDILYIGFSAALSATFNAGRVAAAELREKYPERKIKTVDSLSGSAGQGLLVYLAVLEKQKGASIEQVADFAKQNAPHICHWVTVDDLVYLKRGGRISPTAAFFGNALGIKPMIIVTPEGKLHSHSKVRGRKASIEALVAHYGEQAVDVANGTVFISHADCADEAAMLADKLKGKYGVEVTLTVDIGPVIGAHVGPGGLVLLFVGKERA